jgi:lipopolysaccharide export LptBFGC system permease protein LptF
MSEAEDRSKSLPASKILIAGTILGAVAIAGFIGLWVILGELGVSDTPRLVTSICLPPGILTLIGGGLLLSRLSQLQR